MLLHDLLDETFVDLFVLEGSCLNQSCTGFHLNALAFEATAGTTYYLVADGRSGRVGEVQLELQCGPRPEVCDDGIDNDFDGLEGCLDEDCDGVGTCEFPGERSCDDGIDNDADYRADCHDADCVGTAACPGLCGPTVVDIDCGDTVVADTTGATSHIQVYGCTDMDMSGPELVYRFSPTEFTHVTFSDVADLSDLSLFELPGSCEATSCVRSHVRALEFDAVPGETYFLTADGHRGWEGEVELSLTCDP